MDQQNKQQQKKNTHRTRQKWTPFFPLLSPKQNIYINKNNNQKKCQITQTAHMNNAILFL